MPLGIYRMEETKGLIDGMGTVGCMELMAIKGVLKIMLCDQCHVTPHGKLHGQILEC